MSEPSRAVQELVRDLADRGVDLVRVLWSDLHGVARGKDITLADFARVNEHGVAFCQALLVTDLGANPLDVPESSLGGWPDAVAVPDLGTMRVVDYVDNVAVCVCDINTVQGHDTHSAQPLAFSPRDLLCAQADGLRAEGLHPVVGPELEFYLCRKDSDAPHGWARYQDRDTGAYVVGVANDPDDMLATLLRHCSRMGLSVFAGNHEFSGGQFEINHLHSEAVDAADRVFLFKHAVKEIAVLHGLHATFMGKPFEDRSGSGTHLHVSLTDAEGSNLFDDPADARGLSPLAYSFLAGVLAHAGSPLTAAVQAAGAGEVAPVVRIGGAAASLGALLALIAGVGRTSLAMARNGDLPAWLAAVHPRFRVPHHSELALAVIVSVIVLTTDLRGVIGFSSFGVLVYYGIANASAFTQPSEQRRWPRGLNVLGAVGCAVLVLSLPVASLAAGAAILVLGLIGRRVVALRQSRDELPRKQGDPQREQPSRVEGTGGAKDPPELASGGDRGTLPRK